MLKPTALLALLLVFAVQAAESKTRAECERDYKPRTGQAGKDVIWWPTDDGLVSRMLKMAKVGPSDIVYDLGAGDGRIAITAAKQFGARAIGIEYEAPLVSFGQCLAEVAGVADRVEMRHGDIFASDFSDATVVTMYLLQKLNLRLRPMLLDMKPGTRVISHSFDMGDWQPDDSVAVQFGEAYLWIVPAKVAGTWTFRGEDGGDELEVELKQAYQRLSGESVSEAKLNGSHLELALKDGTRIVGAVDGDRIDAKVTRQGKTSSWSGSR